MGPDLLLPQLRHVPEPGIVGCVRSGFAAVPHPGSARGRAGGWTGAWDWGQDTRAAALHVESPRPGFWKWQKNALPAASRGSQPCPCPDFTRRDPCQISHQNREVVILCSFKEDSV